MNTPNTPHNKTKSALAVWIMWLTAIVVLLLVAATAYAAAPTPSITGGPADRSSTNTNSVTFTFAGTTEMQCSLDSVSGFTPCQSATSQTYSPIAEGLHRFYLRAKDATGTSSFVTRQFTIDRTAPIAPTLSVKPDAQQQAGADGTVSSVFSVTPREPQDGVQGLQCALDSATLTDCSIGDHAYRVAAGQHTYSAREMDAAGNWSELITYSWTVLPYASGTPDTPGVPGTQPGPIASNVCQGTITKLYWQREKRKSMRTKLRIKGSTARAVKGVRVVIRGQVSGCKTGQEMAVYHIVKGKRLLKTGVKVRAGGKFTSFMASNAGTRRVEVKAKNTRTLRFVRVHSKRV
jgi:hypothetical protein